MSETNKKQTFLHGAALLAIAAAVVKLIGFFYKIPLSMIIQPKGFGYFTTAYDVYSMLLLVSTAGLPVAMSRMISQAAALGHYNQVRKIFKVSRLIFLILGVTSTVIMMVGCRVLADLLNQPNAWAAILCLGPSALMMGLMSSYRGFFQGQGNMRPTSNSQMIEALFKLIIGLAAAFVVMKLTKSIPLAAGGAILGVTCSCLVSVIYLRAVFTPSYRELLHSEDTPLSTGATAKKLLAIAVPITIGSAGLQLLTVVESGLYMGRMVDLIASNRYMSHLLTAGMTPQDVADNIKGVYGQAMTIFNMPCALIVPIAISVIPAITSSLTLCDDKAVKETEESAARVTGLISLPCAMGITLLAEPIMGLLWGHSGDDLVLGGQLLAILGICIFLYAIIQYTNSLLQAHGFAHLPVINMLVAGIAKLGVVYILVGNPNIGMLGAPIGAALCYGAIAVMNLITIHRVVPQRPRLAINFLRSLLPALIMGAAVLGAKMGLQAVFGNGASRIILTGGPIAVGVVVYLAAAVFCKSITAEDCKLLPKGEKIAKLLKL